MLIGVVDDDAMVTEGWYWFVDTSYYYFYCRGQRENATLMGTMSGDCFPAQVICGGKLLQSSHMTGMLHSNPITGRINNSPSVYKKHTSEVAATSVTPWAGQF